MSFITWLFSANIAFADAASATASVSTLMSKISTIILNPLILLMFGVALVVMIYGIIEFLSNSDNEESKEKGKQHMLWGLIGMAIMISVFGIMHLIIGTLGLTAPGGGAIQIPSAN